MIEIKYLFYLINKWMKKLVILKILGIDIFEVYFLEFCFNFIEEDV